MKFTLTESEIKVFIFLLLKVLFFLQNEPWTLQKILSEHLYGFKIYIAYLFEQVNVQTFYSGTSFCPTRHYPIFLVKIGISKFQYYLHPTQFLLIVQNSYEAKYGEKFLDYYVFAFGIYDLAKKKVKKKEKYFNLE